LLSRLGIDASPAVQYVIAFAVIFGVLALLALGLRRLTAARLSMPSQDRTRARQPRLGVVDVYDLDRQRQLILLRRDNVEHLLLIGGPNDLVVETNIMRVPARAGAPGENGFDRMDHGAEAPARPVVEPPRPGLDGAVSARLGSVSGLGQEADARAELAPVARTSPQPARGHIEPVLKPDAVATAAGRAPSPGPAARPAAPGAAQGGDPSVLSDMAKQLEHALRRPAAPAPSQPSGPSPSRPDDDTGPGAPSEPARSAPAPQRRPDVVRPAAPTRPVATPPPMEAVPVADAANESAAAADSAHAPASNPVPPAPMRGPHVPPPTPPVAPHAPPGAAPPGPPPAPAAPPAAAAAPPPPPAAAAARAVANDPFSVEEIEAEFARLLGRPLDKAENR
jgi:flagellar protein FliO/FliZ